MHSDIGDLGLLGATVIGDRVTELLYVRAAILAADPAFYSAPVSPAAPAGLGFDSTARGLQGAPTHSLMEV